MKFLKNLKTSQKITTLFWLFNFLSLLLLLLCINIIYFYIWYSDQKEESLYDMNTNYQSIVWTSDSNVDAFKKYILEKDTIIIPNSWEPLTCSEWVAKKLHNNMEVLEEVKDSLFYKWETDWKIYLIFSRHYDDIWEVKILFDTTSYIKSQIIIIKISLILIIIFGLLHILWWKLISKYALKNLRKISKFSWEIDLDKKIKKIEIKAPDDDEIKILATTLNNSFAKIKAQSKNQKQFITDVSHEFKTPLMIINSKIDLYHKKCDKWVCWIQDINNLLWDIKNNTKEAEHVYLETLFMISRFGDGIVQFKKQKTNVSELVDNISTNLIGISQKKVILDTKITRKISKNIELSTFTILLENLLTNAIKFSDDWEIIEVSLTDKKLSIKDNWIWIKKWDLEKVFEKFYRTDENIEWFGVWLFIVKRILNLYDWKIEVKSEYGKWSEFIIKF